MIFLIGLFALVIVAVAFVIGVYNALVRVRNQVRNAWSQIDVQLKRRHDLIPNLVETVKGYATHERETLENVTKARSQAVGAQGVEKSGPGREHADVRTWAADGGRRTVPPISRLTRTS